MFSLTVPTLASIYNGPNENIGSSRLGINASIFPIHYLYGWLDKYFNIHFHLPTLRLLPTDYSLCW